MPIGLLIVIAAVLAGVSALLSAIETALFSLHAFQIRRLRQSNPRLAQALERLMENPRRLLSAILLADSLVNLPLILLCLFLIREVLPQTITIPFWASTLAIFAVIVVLCDLAPKVFALGAPVRIAKLGVRVTDALIPLVDPLSRVLQKISETIADAITPAKFRAHNPMSEEELETLVQLSAEEGTLEAAESEMIQEIIKLGDKTVKDCMTPRVDVFAIPDDLPNAEAIAQLKAKRHRRVPVFGETPDDILGIVEVKRFLLDPSDHYTETMTPPSFVPETMKALDLLRSFLKHPQGMAVIVDEFGGTEGIVTADDIVEEVIGDAVPEGDAELYIEHLGDGRVIASGRTRLDDLTELGFQLEEEGLDTVGGLIFNRLGYLPKAGTHLQIEDVSLTVRRSSRKRVEEVLIERSGNGEQEQTEATT
jgi:putative hemolysin